MSTTYETDFYAWANEQAVLLRAGKLTQADIEHIAEEIESMGKTEKRELVSRLVMLLLHLLKWRFQPDRRGTSWEVTIKVQRRDLARHLRDNPSLKSALGPAIEDAYGDAVLLAQAETRLPNSTFPMTSPWTVEQALNESFWPD